MDRASASGPARGSALLMLLLCLSPLPFSVLNLQPQAWLGAGVDGTAIGHLFAIIAGGHLAGVLLAAVLSLAVRPGRILVSGLAAEGAALVATWLAGPAHGSLALGAAAAGCALLVIGGFGVFPALAGGSAQRSLTLVLACQTGVSTCVPLIAGSAHALMRHDARLEGRLCLALFAAIGIALVLASIGLPWLIRRRVPPAAASAEAEVVPVGLSPAACAPFLMVMVVLMAIHSGVDNAIAQWAPSFIQRAFAHPAFPPAWIVTCTSGGICLGRLLLSRHARRAEIGRLFVQRPPLIGALLIALACLSPWSLAAALCLGLGCMAYGLEYPAMLALISRHAPERLSTAIAIGSALGDVAWMSLTNCIGVAAQSLGMRAGFALAPACLVALGLGAALLPRVQTRMGRMPESLAPAPASAA